MSVHTLCNYYRSTLFARSTLLAKLSMDILT